MRIAIAHYSSRNDISGVTTWLLNLIKSLVDSNHEVFLFLLHFGSDPSKANILSSLESVDLTIESRIRKNDVSDVLSVIKWLNSVQPDLFLPQCLHSNYIAASIAGKQGLPWIFTFHSDDPEYWVVSDLLKPNLNNAITICVSQHLKKRLDPENNNTDFRFIPYGVICSAEKVKYNSEKLTVVYLGRLVEEQKRISTVVDTIIKVCSSCDDVDAIFIGDGIDMPICLNKVNASGFSSRIKFVGVKSRIEIESILQNSHIITLMSEYEGLPISLLEAMSFGVVPVVRNIQSGIPELVHHGLTGLLVENDAEDAAKSIVEVIHNKRVWENISTNSRDLILQNYDLKNSLKSMEEAILFQSQKSKPNYPLKYIHDFHNKIYRESRCQGYYLKVIKNYIDIWLYKLVDFFFKTSSR